MGFHGSIVDLIPFYDPILRRNLLNEDGEPSANKKERQQSRRPAVVNIAKKELRLSDNEYQDVITYRGDRSSAAMSISEHGDLVKYFEKRVKFAFDPYC